MTDLAARVAALEARVSILEARTAKEPKPARRQCMGCGQWVPYNVCCQHTVRWR